MKVRNENVISSNHLNNKNLGLPKCNKQNCYKIGAVNYQNINKYKNHI